MAQQSQSKAAAEAAKRKQYNTKGIAGAKESTAGGQAGGHFVMADEELPELGYELKEVGGKLFIKQDGAKGFSPIEQFLKLPSNKEFKPQGDDLGMFNKHNLFMPEEAVPAQAPVPPTTTTVKPQAYMQDMFGGMSGGFQGGPAMMPGGGAQSQSAAGAIGVNRRLPEDLFLRDLGLV